jgi:hypothetical protein
MVQPMPPPYWVRLVDEENAVLRDSRARHETQQHTLTLRVLVAGEMVRPNKPKPGVG